MFSSQGSGRVVPPVSFHEACRTDHDSGIDFGGSGDSGPESPVHAATEAGCLFGSRAASSLKAKQIWKGAQDHVSAKIQQATRQAVTRDEVQGLVDRMKAELLADIKAELQVIAISMRDTASKTSSTLDELHREAQELRQDIDVIKARVERGPLSRAVANYAYNLCGSGEETKSRAKKWDPRPLLPMASPMDTPPTEATPCESSEATAEDSSSVDKKETSPRSKDGCLLTPVLRRFEVATGSTNGQAPGPIRDVDKEAFILGLEEYAKLLDHIGGSMGSYLTTNIKKLRNSKARSDKAEYREWLMLELPVHKATGYRQYVDDSAWMANLWIGRSLQFFVELFCQIHKGQDTSQAVEYAYYATLYEHHNFFQRASFMTAMKRMPSRDHLLEILSGRGTKGDVEKDLREFVEHGRCLVKFCLAVNEELDGQLKIAQKAL